MMQPLGLQNRAAFSPGLASPAGNVGQASTFSAPQQQTARNTDSGQNSLATLGPILVQLLQGLLMLMQQITGQQGANGQAGAVGSTGNAGNMTPPGTAAGNAGNAGQPGSADNSGNMKPPGTAAGNAGNAGQPGTADNSGNMTPPGTAAGNAGNAGQPGTADNAGNMTPTTGEAGNGGYGTTTPSPTDGTGTPSPSPTDGTGGTTPDPTTGGGTAPTPTPGDGSPNLTGLPGGSQGTGQAAGESIDQIRNTDYGKLTEAQRVQFNGVSRESAAIIHLGGRANISGAVTDNGVSPTAQIYNNVLQNPGNFKPEERALIQKWSQQEMTQRGMITGEHLDHAFIDEMGTRDGVDPQRLQQYHAAVDQRVNNLMASPNRAAAIADSKKTLNLVDDTTIIQQQSGLSKTEQAAFRLAGHSVLFSGDGKVNGDILAITMGNANALDNKGANNGTIDQETQALIKADVADNGKIDGSSLKAADGAVLDKLYAGGQGISNNQQVVNQGVQTGLSNGRSMQSIQKSIMNGGQQALNDFKQMAKNHSPAMLAAGATMAGAAAVCPFLGGMAAGAAGIGAANKMMNQNQNN
jgi:hypothetical protein